MFKNRMFLTGLGVGIMIGALLLQLMLIGERSEASLGERLGSGAEEKVYTQRELDDAIAAERAAAQGAAAPSDSAKAGGEAGKPEADDADGKEQGTSTETPKPSPNDATSPPPQTEAPSKDEPPLERVVQIEGGMNLTQTAKRLADAGVIDKQASLIAEMKRKNKRVRAGYFLFTGQPELADVVRTITGQPLTKEEREELAKRGVE
ncbi:hypothetical protein [Paenibacillus sp. NPDC058071]|uniref:hypothetical protein n=1 Tax=Paenibacillus sp. NPDC058071 TaxID=3346326 RepID=UPI0036D979FE